MEHLLINTRIEIIFEIIKITYDLDKNLEFDLDSDIDLENSIIHFVSDTLFILNKEKLLLCLIQEFDKLIYGKINDDINKWKFNENNRIKVSQFTNKIHSYIKKKLKNE